MKYCPACSEEFDEDEFNFCTFDGATLELIGGGIGFRQASERFTKAPSIDSPDDEAGEVQPAQSNATWKVAAFIVIATLLLGAAAYAVFLSSRTTLKSPAAQQVGQPSAASRDSSQPAEQEAAPEPIDITEMTRDGLMKVIPKSVLARFNGALGAGVPDDIRVLTEKEDQYVVLVGGAGRDPLTRATSDRIVVLKYENETFSDVTRQAVPGSIGAGTLRSPGGLALESAGKNLIVRQPVSSRAIVDECPTCEHAYHRVTMEWEGSRYVEKERSWDNDRYTAFYVLAEALEKGKIDGRARPMIDRSLDETVAQRFPRPEKRGWTVETLTEDKQATTADYQLRNGSDRLVIRVSQVNGSWRAVRITER